MLDTIWSGQSSDCHSQTNSSTVATREASATSSSRSSESAVDKQVIHQNPKESYRKPSETTLSLTPHPSQKTISVTECTVCSIVVLSPKMSTWHQRSKEAPLLWAPKRQKLLCKSPACLNSSVRINNRNTRSGCCKRWQICKPLLQLKSSKTKQRSSPRFKAMWMNTCKGLTRNNSDSNKRLNSNPKLSWTNHALTTSNNCWNKSSNSCFKPRMNLLLCQWSLLCRQQIRYQPGQVCRLWLDKGKLTSNPPSLCNSSGRT